MKSCPYCKPINFTGLTEMVKKGMRLLGARDYVNWSEVPAEYEWVAVQGPDWTWPGEVRMYKPKLTPYLCDPLKMWNGYGNGVPNHAIIGPLPPWRKSLRRRPA